MARFSRKWRRGEIWALAFLFLGLVIILFVAATEGEQAVWTLWFAIPMIMFSLVYLLLVNAIPVFFGDSPDDEPKAEQSREKGDE